MNGVVVVSPIPSRSQRDPNEELGLLLRVYRLTHPGGQVLDKTLSEEYVRLAEGRRLADRVIWAGLGRLPGEDETPTIAVEFVSRRKRDRDRDYAEKKREYLAVGVKEYGIIDPFRRVMTVCRKRRGKLVEQVVPEAGTYKTDLLPGFELPLGRLLALSDAWQKRKRKK
jgi:Uma2 family endonuclease